MAKNKQSQGAGSILITYLFESPRERIWKAWTEPELLMKWWGPRSFTAPVSKIDLRVGGKYIACMRSPDGKDYWSTGTYKEIVKPERLVLTDSFSDAQGKIVPASYYGMSGDWPLELQITVTFEEQGAKTKLTLRHEGLPESPNRELTKAGWIESFDKLAQYLEKGFVTMPKTTFIAEPGKQEITIIREFDAPRDRVFKLFTNPKLLPQWWGPRRLTTVVDKMDVRPGGLWRFVQKDSSGMQYAVHGVYHEVSPPERMVYTFEFEGTPGNVLLETVTFEERDGKTIVTDKSVFQRVEDRDGMVVADMQAGSDESMERFAELLAKQT
jgi:uncharacterized protein YndB with AHSA1/START domain